MFIGLFIGTIPALYALGSYGGAAAIGVLALCCALFISIAYKIAAWMNSKGEQKLEASEALRFQRHPEREIVATMMLVGVVVSVLFFFSLILLPASIVGTLFGWMQWNPSGLPFVSISILTETIFLALSAWVAIKYLVHTNRLQRVHSAVALTWKSCVTYFIIVSFLHWQAFLQSPLSLVYSGVSFIPGAFIVWFLITRAQRSLVDTASLK